MLFAGMPLAAAETRLVGPGRTYTRPSLACAAAQDGDTILIDPGTYSDDPCVWTRAGLTIRGVGARPRLTAVSVPVAATGLWNVTGAGATIENLEFAGFAATTLDGAGLRAEGAGITVRTCLFRDNQNGLRAIDNAASDVVIEASEFAANGIGNGASHNLVVDRVRSLTMRFCSSHGAIRGDLLRSRAATNRIIANRLMDEAAGTSVFAINLPIGGRTYLTGNLIQQALSSVNTGIVTYAQEGAANPDQHLFAVNNTIVNDGNGGIVFNTRPATTVALLANNLLVGTGTVLNGPGTQSNQVVVGGGDAGFVSRAGYDYQLVSGSPAIDAGRSPLVDGTDSLLPTLEYVDPCAFRPRSATAAAIDAGAYEFVPAGTGTGTSSGGSDGSGGITPTGSGTGSSSGSSGNGSNGGGGACGVSGAALAIVGLLAAWCRRRGPGGR